MVFCKELFHTQVFFQAEVMYPFLLEPTRSKKFKGLARAPALDERRRRTKLHMLDAFSV